MVDTAAKPSFPNPYVGPVPFLEGQKLYGRVNETDALYNLLISKRIVLLFSPSGAGKTSLIQAALVPRLRSRLNPLPIIRLDRILNVEDGLTNRYLLSAIDSIESRFPQSERIKDEHLSGQTFGGYLSQRLTVSEGNESAKFPLIILDQFEELFTLNRFDWEKKEDFLKQLGQALGGSTVPSENEETVEGKRSAPPMWALLSMREDYLAELEPFLDLIPTGLAYRYRLEPLERDRALEAVRGPAGKYFREDAAERLVDNLRRLRAQTPTGEEKWEEGRFVEPVHLQVVCQRLWDKVVEVEKRPIALGDVGTTEQTSKVDAALSAYYDLEIEQAVREKGVRQRDLRDWIQQELITRTKIRTKTLREPAAMGKLDAAVQLLVKAHVLRIDVAGDREWIELAHDRLINPVLKSNEDWGEKHLALVQKQAKLWAEAGKSKRELLFSGEELDEAERFAAEHPDDVGPDDQEFLEASRLERKRVQDDMLKKAQIEQKNKQLMSQRRTLIWLSVAIFIASLIVIYYMLEAKNQAGIAKEATVRANKALVAEKKATEDLQISLSNERIAKNEAIQAKNSADENARRAHARQLAAQAITLANEQPDLALLLSLEAIRIDNSPESRSSLFTALGRSTPQLSQYLRGHDRAVWRLAFNRAGDRLASGDENGTIILWNIRTGMPSGPLLTGHKGYIHSLAINPKGNLLATIDVTGTLRLWDAETARLLNDLEPETGSFMRVAFSPDDRLLAAGKTDGSILLYDLSTFSSGKFAQRPVRELSGTGKATQALVFSGDSSILASAHDESYILWNTATGKPLCIPQGGHTDTIYGLAFSADGKTLATGSEDMKVILWDVADPCRPNSRLQPLTGHTDAVTGVAFSPDDRVLYSASGDRSVRMWDAATGKQIGRPLTGHANAVLSLALGDNGNVLATGGMAGSIILWNIYTQHRLGVPLYGMLVPVRSIAFSPDGSKLASAGHDNSIILWDAARQQQEGDPLVSTSAQGKDNSKEWVTSLIFHPHQDLLYAGSTDWAIRVWDTRLHKENGTPMMLNKGVLSLALSHNSRFLASGDNEKNIIIWDLETRKKKHPPLTKHTDAIWSLAFNKDDTILASGSDDMSVRLWDVKSGEAKGSPLTGYSGRVSSVAFSPRNGFLYTACEDEIIRWDITRSPPERRLLYKSEDRTSRISNLDFSPDGSMLAVGIGSTVIFIHPETGKTLFEPAPGLGSSIWSVVFDRQGKTVASGSSGGTVILWNPRTGKRFGRFMLGHHRDVHQIALSSDGTLLALRSNDNKIEIVQLGHGNRRIEPLEVRSGETITALVFNALSSASRQLFTASNDEKGRILSWDLGTEQPTSSPIAGATGYLHSLAISPDGATLAAGSDEGGITLWDLSTTPPAKRPLPGHGKDANGANKPVWGLAFSKDGRLLASGSTGEFIIWDVGTGDRLATHLEEGAVKDFLYGLQFNPTAPILAVPNKRGDIVLWNVSDPRKIWKRNYLKGHSGSVSSLSFSPDGKTLASGSDDHTVRLWDTDSGHPLSLGSMRHNDRVKSVVFSRDNKELYSGGKDGLIMQWDVDIERLKLNAIRTPGRNLTEQEWGKYLPKQRYSKTHPMPLLLEADLLSLKGERTAAKERYREIVEMIRMSNDASLLNCVCWTGSVDGFADTVMAACDRAVSKASPDDIDNYRDTRGVARATANPPRIKEAIEDFQAFVGWTEHNPKYTPVGNLRRQWIRELQDGRNPFDEERLRQMRNETME